MDGWIRSKIIIFFSYFRFGTLFFSCLGIGSSLSLVYFCVIFGFRLRPCSCISLARSLASMARSKAVRKSRRARGGKVALKSLRDAPGALGRQSRASAVEMGTPGRSRRRRTWVIALVLALFLMVGGIVLVVLALTGAFKKRRNAGAGASPSSPAPSPPGASSPSPSPVTSSPSPSPPGGAPGQDTAANADADAGGGLPVWAIGALIGLGVACFVAGVVVFVVFRRRMREITSAQVSPEVGSGGAASPPATSAAEESALKKFGAYLEMEVERDSKPLTQDLYARLEALRKEFIALRDRLTEEEQARFEERAHQMAVKKGRDDGRSLASQTEMGVMF